MANTQTEKWALRKNILLARKNMPEEDFAIRSRKIVQQLERIPEIQQARVLHAFWPITKNQEVDIRPLLNSAYQKGRVVVLPYMKSFSSKVGSKSRLEHRLFTGETNLRANRWDVYEPQADRIIPLSDLNAVIVPALAVDKQGYRLGYGKGYYDEFLSQIRCPTICPVFDTFFVDNLPRDDHDVPVTIIVSEDGILWRY